MGKQSRHKKNRPSHSAHANQAAAGVTAAARNALPASLQGKASGGVQAAAPHRSLSPLDVQTDYIRTDIARILLLLVLVLVILFGCFLVNQKTSAISRAGRALSQFTQLQ